MKKFFSFFVAWFCSCVVITIIFFTIYWTVQQNYRQGAYDPGIEIAENVARLLNNGENSLNFDAPSKIDISISLSPYLIIYDSNGKPIAGTAQLDGQIPSVPFGVLEWADKRGENRISWQPRKNVRSAIVTVPFHGQQSGYVLAGRSMREVENRIWNHFKITALTWAVSIFVNTFGFLLFWLVRRHHNG